ncbi:hypothetical protein D3C80_1542190 [compost metagenome]
MLQRGVQHHRLVGVVLLNRHFQCRFGAVDRITRMLQFFTADGVKAAQYHAALQIVLRLAQVRLAQGNVGLILLAVDDQLVGLTHAVGQAGFGAFQRLFGIGRIQREQHIPLLHVVGIVEVDAVNATVHLGHDLHLVTGHIGVVRFLMMTQHQEPIH